jgi:hypothetical protein
MLKADFGALNEVTVTFFDSSWFPKLPEGESVIVAFIAFLH